MLDWLWNPDHLSGVELRDQWIGGIGALVSVPLITIVLIQLASRLGTGHWAWYWAWWPF